MGPDRPANAGMIAPLLSALLLLLFLHPSGAGARDPGAVNGTGTPETPAKVVVRRQGDDSVNTYRIPGLATTPKGTLIAVFDMRRNGARDLPADIDVGATRSTDLGRTWGPTTVVLDFDSREEGSLGNGVGDPAILVDGGTGRIFVVALWSKGDRGWQGSGPGLSPGETGQLVMATSDDDGLTWSPPRNLTGLVAGRDPTWRLFFAAPGRGIQLNDGTLIFAAQFRDHAGTPRSCFMYSRDGGGSWTVSPPAIPAGVPDGVPTSESQVAELPDGRLLLSMRNEAKGGRRAWAVWTWKDVPAGGEWGDPWLRVTDPTCMASLVRHPLGLLLLSNPDSPKDRVALTVRASVDNGLVWTDGRVIESGPSGYSCMTVLPDGSVGVLYETGRATELETLTFARFTMDWFLGE